MPQQQTKSDFDWRDFSRSDWAILAAVLGTVVAVAVVIYMGYGKELLQAARWGAHKMQEHARDHYSRVTSFCRQGVPKPPVVCDQRPIEG